jgi:hypothetical protein
VARSGFEWGWDAFVALGTLALALATFVLAWGTRRMAQATRADVRAQWRPAITPGADPEVTYIERDKVIALSIKNVGRGAAYCVDAGLDIGGFVAPASMAVPGTMQPRNYAVFAAGDEIDLYFTHVNDAPKEKAH